MNEEEKLLDAPSEEEALELLHELKCKTVLRNID